MSAASPAPSKGMGRNIVIVAVVIVVVLAIAGYYLLSGMGSANTTTSTTSPKTTSIGIPSGTGKSNGGLSFSPQTVTVVIGVNNTVTWANGDTDTHSVIFSSAPSGVTLASLTDPNNLKAGQSYTVTLTTPGTYQYYCQFHNWMKGTITVVQ